MTNGWKLDRTERDALLRDHPPTYEQVVADHVTLDIEASDAPHPERGGKERDHPVYITMIPTRLK